MNQLGIYSYSMSQRGLAFGYAPTTDALQLLAGRTTYIIGSLRMNEIILRVTWIRERWAIAGSQ